jgi:hypothetical protein
MPATYKTTSDVLQFGDAMDADLASNVLDDAPLIASLPARDVAGSVYRYRRKIANPEVGFRSENDGRENSTGEYLPVVAPLAILDASFALDVAVASADERGTDASLAEEGVDHLRAAMFDAEQQLLYGSDVLGFEGLADLLPYLDSDMVIGAGGTAANTGSSVFALVEGPSDTQVLWGEGGVVDIGEPTIQRVAGATGHYPAHFVPISAWCGLKVGSTYSAARLCNLTEQSNKGLTDALLGKLYSLFPVSRKPTKFVMSGRSQEQLRAARTATNPTGAEAPLPTEVFGVPIIVTDAVSNTEAIVAAEPVGT